MSLKTLREILCSEQAHAKGWPSDIASAVDVLVEMIDRHRPLGSDGTHGDLHTETCGCEQVEGPHSRACGIRPHPHGTWCNANCPTCHGEAQR